MFLCVNDLSVSVVSKYGLPTNINVFLALENRQLSITNIKINICCNLSACRDNLTALLKFVVSLFIIALEFYN